ncbi:unnamed protein product [Ophioblennius macclurei]
MTPFMDRMVPDSCGGGAREVNR